MTRTLVTSTTFDGRVLDWPLPAGPHGTIPPIYQQLRKTREACRLRMPSGDLFWLFTDRDDIHQIVTDKRFSRDLTHPDAPRFARGPDFGSMDGAILNTDPPRHTRIRRVVNPFYTAEIWEAARPMIRAKALELIEAMRSGPTVADLVTAYSEPLALHVSVTALGIPLRLRTAYMDVFRTQVDFEAAGEQSTDALSQISDLATHVLHRHEAAPSGVVGALVAARNAGTLTPDEVHGTVVYLLVTATEPLIGPVSTFALTLLRDHAQRALKACETKPALWPDAVSELLRIHHNGMISLPRQATEDVEVGDVLVRTGEGVITPYLAATMDPAHAPNPDYFNILRGDRATMTFGAGPHYCLGSALTRAYLHEALRTLFTALPTLTLAVNPLDVPWMPPETLFTRPRRLPVTW